MAAVAAAALLAAPTAAHAEWYAGAAYTQYDVDDADEVGGLTGRLGYRFNPNFAVEGEGTFGVNDGDDAELNHAVGLYGVAAVPFGNGFDVHGRLGYNQIDLERDAAPDLDDGGLSYGGGVGYRFAGGFGVQADWTRTETDEDDADAISIGGSVLF
jgi:hypothetical protein